MLLGVLRPVQRIKGIPMPTDAGVKKLAYDIARIGAVFTAGPIALKEAINSSANLPHNEAALAGSLAVMTGIALSMVFDRHAPAHLDIVEVKKPGRSGRIELPRAGEFGVVTGYEDIKGSRLHCLKVQFNDGTDMLFNGSELRIATKAQRQEFSRQQKARLPFVDNRRLDAG
jgi:hypothetical protein